MTASTLLDGEAGPPADPTPPPGSWRRLVRGTVGLSAGRGVASLISAAWLVLVARHVSIRHFGDLTLLLALGAVFTTISDPGLQFALAKHVATSRRIHADVLRVVLLRRQVAGLVCAALTAGLYLLAADDHDLVVPCIFAVSILCTTVYASSLTAYRALGHVALDGGNEIISRILVIGVGTWWLMHGGGLRAVVATYALADACSALVIYLLIRKRFVVSSKPRAPVDVSLRATAPLALVMITQIVYWRLDTYLVGLIKGASAAGLYGAAYRFLDGALIPAAAVGSVILAHTARLTNARVHHDTRRYAVIAVLLTVPFMVIGALIAPFALRDLFGPVFARASATAVILLISAAPSAVVAAYAPVAGLINRGAFALGALLALALNAAANLAFVPLFGLPGAAWVNAGSQLFLAFWLVKLVGRRARTAPLAPAGERSET
jgi:O-antigen/teichoic acid export membrane protein